MVERLVLKKYADCTSQRLKWTSGAWVMKFVFNEVALSLADVCRTWAIFDRRVSDFEFPVFPYVSVFSLFFPICVPYFSLCFPIFPDFPLFVFPIFPDFSLFVFPMFPYFSLFVLICVPCVSLFFPIFPFLCVNSDYILVPWFAT